MSDTTDFRDAIAAKLEIAGERCIEILREEAPYDPLIVLAATSAAVAHPSLPVSLAELSTRVCHAAVDRREVFVKVLEELDLSEASIDLDGPEDERVDRLDRLVNLACVATIAPADAAVGILLGLQRNEVLAVCKPEIAAPLAERAIFLGDTLDLKPRHPARTLLAAIIDASHVVRTAFRPGAFEAAVERGRTATLAALVEPALELNNVVDLTQRRATERPVEYRLKGTPSALAAAADSGREPPPNIQWEPLVEAHGIRVDIAEAQEPRRVSVYVAVLASPDAKLDLTLPNAVSLTGSAGAADGSCAHFGVLDHNPLYWRAQLGAAAGWQLTVKTAATDIVVELKAP